MYRRNSREDLSRRKDEAVVSLMRANRLGLSTPERMVSAITEYMEPRIATVPEGGCWLWTGTLTTSGYGSYKIDGKQRRAHRLSYELFVGHIPDGLELHHKCLVKSCVNPYHLELVTHKENLNKPDAQEKKGWSRRNNVTHCPQGHPYSEENTFWRSRPKKSGDISNPVWKRACKRCRNEAGRKWRERKNREGSA